MSKVSKSFNIDSSLVDKIKDECATGGLSGSSLVNGVLDAYFNNPSKRIKKVNQEALANYLGVSKSAVSQYNRAKLELMLLGLNVKLNQL